MYLNDADAQSPRGDELTRRELEILVLLGEGRAAKQMATACCISDRTVRKHSPQA